MIKLAVPLSFAVLLFISCKTKVEKIKPAEEKITESVYASGILKSKNQYQVFSSVNGLVAEILVSEGDLVKKGDAIIRLTNTTAQLNTENAGIVADYSSIKANAEKLNELKVNIEQTKTRMEMDASLLERQRNLWAQQIGSYNEVGQREMAYNVSLAAYETAKFRYSEMQKQLSLQEKQSKKNLQISKTIAGDYRIVSNTDGKVYSILKEKGEMVNTQSPVALIGDGSAFQLELQVDEYDIARIKTGQKIMVSMDSYKGQVFEAVVEKIDPIMNERSKSFTIEAAFVKQPPALYPNLTCEANIIIRERDKVLTIPRSFLLEGDFVILESKEKRKVNIGLKDYQKAEIISGLTANDIIIKPLK